MPNCNRCTKPFDWGFDGERWVPLEPVATHDDLDRTFVDENGVARADHRDRHPEGGGSGVNVKRLPVKIPAAVAAENQPSTINRVAEKRGRRSRRTAS